MRTLTRTSFSISQQYPFQTSLKNTTPSQLSKYKIRVRQSKYLPRRFYSVDRVGSRGKHTVTGYRSGYGRPVPKWWSRRHSELMTTVWLTGRRKMRITADERRSGRIRTTILGPATRRWAVGTRSIKISRSGRIRRRWKRLRNRARCGGTGGSRRGSILRGRWSGRRPGVGPSSRRSSSDWWSWKGRLTLVAGRRSRIILPRIGSETLIWTWPLPWRRGWVLQCAWQRDLCRGYTSITTCKVEILRAVVRYSGIGG